MKIYGRFSEISDDFSDFKQKNMGELIVNS